MMKAINQAALTDITFPNRDTIFFKFQGSERVRPALVLLLYRAAALTPTCLASQMRAEAFDMVKGIVPRHGGDDLRNSASKEESEEIWRGRRVSLAPDAGRRRSRRFPLTCAAAPSHRWPTGRSWPSRPAQSPGRRTSAFRSASCLRSSRRRRRTWPSAA